MTHLNFTLRDFSLRENHLAGYPSLLSQEHNIRLAVRLLADAHPNFSLRKNFAKLNIMFNSAKTILMTIIIFCVLFLSGCSDGVSYFYSIDSAQCTIQCKQIIKKNWCGTGYSNFGSQCKCVMLDCVRKVTIEEKPENYTDFRTRSSSSISQSNNQECYKNGKKVNCSDNFDIDEFIKMVKGEE